MNSASNSTARPFLRWAGSKKKLLGDLEAYWSDSFERYVEPFAGSACLFFRLHPKAALLSDKNEQLIDTYRLVGTRPKQIYREVKALPRNQETYYALRSRDPSTLSRTERAVRFIYLNRNCFNGIYRTNLRGEFNVPYGGDRAGELITESAFIESAKALKGASLRNWDFGTTLRNTKAGDFVYLDPPYAVTETRVFCEYSGRPFSTIDLARMESHLKKMDSRGVKFVVSYANSKEARPIAERWNHRIISVRRNIAGFAGARRNSDELLFSNLDLP